MYPTTTSNNQKQAFNLEKKYHTARELIFMHMQHPEIPITDDDINNLSTDDTSLSTGFKPEQNNIYSDKLTN